MARILAIANQKGGVGKTTTAVNLGAALSQLGKRVLLVDSDPQGNTTSGLGVEKQNIEQCIYDVIVNSAPISDIIVPAGIDNLFVLPATLRLAGAEVELVSAMARERRLATALQSIQDDYDYIIIDCPPSLGLLTINSLTAAQGVLVPIQCEFYALEGLSQLLNVIEMVRKHLNSEVCVKGVILTMYDARLKLCEQVAEDVRGHFGDKVFKTVIPRNVRLAEAPSFGSPAVIYDRASKGARAYAELAKEVVNCE
ncbi:MAG: AAA family ATPase [bacterium]|nr:AAA family ATPase [bacterium]